jgi:hypothetical protein
MGAGDKALGDAIAARLSDMGVVRGEGKAEGGEDVGYIAAEQKAVIDMRQDMTHYFDLHHTPDDTLDKVDPADLQQNVDTWAEVLKIAECGDDCSAGVIGGKVGVTPRAHDLSA